jgi:hypothetical protein
MMVGCGGGFDFVHSMMLYPELKRMNKKIVMTSFSFGDVREVKSKADIWIVTDIRRKDCVEEKRCGDKAGDGPIHS